MSKIQNHIPEVVRLMINRHFPDSAASERCSIASDSAELLLSHQTEDKLGGSTRFDAAQLSHCQVPGELGLGKVLDDIEQAVVLSDKGVCWEDTSMENLMNAREFFTSSKAIQHLHDNLRIWVFPVTRDYIKNSILVNTRLGDGSLRICCEIDWQLAQYCEKELSGSSTLHQVLTITGSPTRAQAASCEDYISQTWGYMGQCLLNAIVGVFEKDCLGEWL